MNYFLTKIYNKQKSWIWHFLAFIFSLRVNNPMRYEWILLFLQRWNSFIKRHNLNYFDIYHMIKYLCILEEFNCILLDDWILNFWHWILYIATRVFIEMTRVFIEMARVFTANLEIFVIICADKQRFDVELKVWLIVPCFCSFIECSQLRTSGYTSIPNLFLLGTTACTVCTAMCMTGLPCSVALLPNSERGFWLGTFLFGPDWASLRLPFRSK